MHYRDNFFRKSPEAMWADLPPRKSLFHMDGLEIGNLPNQIWANFLGAVFTMWMIFVKKVDGFIIFVDDFKFLVRSAEDGRRLIKEIREFLDKELHITLPPGANTSTSSRISPNVSSGVSMTRHTLFANA